MLYIKLDLRKYKYPTNSRRANRLPAIRDLQNVDINELNAADIVDIIAVSMINKKLKLLHNFQNLCCS